MRTRSILVYLPAYPFTFMNLMPNRSLASAAACLIGAGHFTRIQDYGTLETLEQLASSPPSLRRLPTFPGRRRNGPGLRPTLEAFHRQVSRELAAFPRTDFIAFYIEDRPALAGAVQVSKRLREIKPDLKLVGFGPGTRLCGGTLLKTATAFDCLCLHDGGRALAQLADRIHAPQTWGTIPGLLIPAPGHPQTTPGPDTHSLVLLPGADYGPATYPALRSRTKLMLFTIEDSHGCDFTCHGCPRGSARRPFVQTRPSAAVADEVWRIGKEYGARAFHFCNAGSPAAQVKAVACELMARHLTVWYSRAWHVRHTSPAALRALTASGCRAVSFRIDTGSQRLLDDYYGRGFGVTETESVLRASKAAGLFTVARFTYPCPEDDTHTREETLRLLERARPHSAPVAVPELLPGSAWDAHPENFGFRPHTERQLGALLRRLQRDGARGVPRGFMPRRIGVWTAVQAIRENASLRRTIEERGIPSTLPEDVALMAKFAGYDGREVAFADMLGARLRNGDAAGAAAFVEGFNDAACVPARELALRRLAPLRAAVGN
ncbi:MAG TPA: hypothetical protein HPP83_08885 [Candidatus Hydrogenedentes bacterium]|nr:hypothetical protein [Candidatus Hydrogenedentota bacterium]